MKNLEDLFGNLIPKAFEYVQTPDKSVVRLSTSFYRRGNSVVAQQQITLLKRKSGHSWAMDLLFDDPGWIARIVNLDTSDDGIYELTPIDVTFDGVDDFDCNFKLIPYVED